MVSKNIVLLVFASGALLLGFRSIPGASNWDIDRSSTTNSKLFVVYPTPARTLENDLPAGDPLHGTATITFAQAMTSILNDYNNIGASFLVLADNTDPDFAARSVNRLITIEEADPQSPLSGGDASLTTDGDTGRTTACRIRISGKLMNKASDFIWATAHEMGHCLGLDHPQDVTRAVMSYFSPERYTRLQADDKMGITFLYPARPENAKEIATFGMSCSKQ